MHAMEDNKQVAVLALALPVLLVIVLSKLKSLFLVTAKPELTKKLPPGPWTLPLIGSLHHLVNKPTIYRAFRDLARRHGPVMLLRLGEVPTLVVSSPEAAQELLKAHDVTFADRYMNVTTDILSFHGTDMVFAPYGERWRQLRKISVLELLSTSRVQSFRRVREEEVARFVRRLADAAGSTAAVDLSQMISRFVNDTFMRESIGSRCKYQEEYLDALKAAIQVSGLTAASLFPSSRLLRILSSAPRKALESRHRMARVLEKIIRDTKEAMDRPAEGDSRDDGGMVGVLLKLQKEASLPIPLTNDTIVVLMFDLFAAGSESSSTVLTWCMTELIRHPAVMAKLQAEVREAFSGKTTITEGDLAGAQLSYLKLVMKETLRLHCPVPLLIPRRSREVCQVMGYHIPKGTSVLVNVWAIGREPKYWQDAEEFKPERFHGSNLDYSGTHFEFLPFGAGRRMCPGANLGLANLELALASMLYHFDWKLPTGVEAKDVDVYEKPDGLIASKKTSLILHPVNRFICSN